MKAMIDDLLTRSNVYGFWRNVWIIFAVVCIGYDKPFWTNCASAACLIAAFVFHDAMKKE